MRDHRLLPVPSVVGAAKHWGTLRTAVPQVPGFAVRVAAPVF